jgi:hypothetical protein
MAPDGGEEQRALHSSDPHAEDAILNVAAQTIPIDDVQSRPQQGGPNERDTPLMEAILVPDPQATGPGERLARRVRARRVCPAIPAIPNLSSLFRPIFQIEFLNRQWSIGIIDPY